MLENVLKGHVKQSGMWESGARETWDAASAWEREELRVQWEVVE